MSDKSKIGKWIIEKHYSNMPREYLCASELYLQGIRESDFGVNGDFYNIPDGQRIPIMGALRDIERTENDY